MLPFEGKGIRVGVFVATVRDALGIFKGSTFIGGSDNGATEGCVARLPGNVFPRLRRGVLGLGVVVTFLI